MSNAPPRPVCLTKAPKCPRPPTAPHGRLEGPPTAGWRGARRAERSEEGGEDGEDVEEHIWVTAGAPRVGVASSWRSCSCATTPRAQGIRRCRRGRALAATVHRLIHTTCRPPSPDHRLILISPPLQRTPSHTLTHPHIPPPLQRIPPSPSYRHMYIYTSHVSMLPINCH